MPVTVDRKQLKMGLAIAKTALTGCKDVMPLRKRLWLTSTPERLRMEIGRSMGVTEHCQVYFVPGVGDAEKTQVAVDVKALYKVIDSAKADKLELTVEENVGGATLKIVGDGVETVLTVWPITEEDLPQYSYQYVSDQCKEKIPNLQLSLPSEEFVSLIEAVLPAAGKDATRPLLYCVGFFADSEKNVMVVATDTWRLFQRPIVRGVTELNMPPGFGDYGEDPVPLGLLDRTVLATLVRGLKKLKGERVDLTIYDNYWLVDCGELHTATRTLEGEFPNFSRVIPADETLYCHLEIDYEEMAAAINKIKSIVAEDKHSRIIMDIGTDALGGVNSVELTAAWGDARVATKALDPLSFRGTWPATGVGSVKPDMNSDVDKEQMTHYERETDMNLCFNYKQFLDGAKQFGERFRLRCPGNNLRPFIIDSPDNVDLGKYILMPVRIP